MVPPATEWPARLSFYVGGPSYRNQVHTGHMGCVAQVAVHAARRGHSVADLDYAHTSVLPIGRAEWLDHACESDADVGIGIDSDTWTDGVALVALAEALMGSAEPWALCGVIVPQRDGKNNAWEAPLTRMSRDKAPRKAGEIVEAYAIGAALCLYNLHWYRKERTAATESERFASGRAVINASYAVVPTQGGDAFISEDYYHCTWLHVRGGKRLATRIDGTKHAGGF